MNGGLQGFPGAAGGAARQATKSIVTSHSLAAANASGLNQAPITRQVLSGALTANTLRTVLSVSGSGEVPYLAGYAINTTSRTVRVRVLVDGSVVFDATSSAVTTAGSGLLVTGIRADATAFGGTTVPIYFRNSFEVQLASSLTETDLVAIAYTLFGY
jgi:hypothetical protein